MRLTLPGPFMTATLLALVVALAAPLIPAAGLDPAFAGVPPLLAVVLAAGLAVVAILHLQAIGWSMPGQPSGRALGLALATGAGLGLAALVLDALIGLPRAATLPLLDGIGRALLEAYIVTAVLVLGPTYLAAQLLSRAFGAAAALAAVPAPAVALWAMGATASLGSGLLALVLYAVAWAQIHAQRRAGFAASASLRLGFLLVWAVVWPLFAS